MEEGPCGLRWVAEHLAPLHLLRLLPVRRPRLLELPLLVRQWLHRLPGHPHRPVPPRLPARRWPTGWPHRRRCRRRPRVARPPVVRSSPSARAVRTRRACSRWCRSTMMTMRLRSRVTPARRCSLPFRPPRLSAVEARPPVPRRHRLAERLRRPGAWRRRRWVRLRRRPVVEGSVVVRRCRRPSVRRWGEGRVHSVLHRRRPPFEARSRVKASPNRVVRPRRSTPRVRPRRRRVTTPSAPTPSVSMPW